VFFAPTVLSVREITPDLYVDPDNVYNPATGVVAPLLFVDVDLHFGSILRQISLLSGVDFVVTLVAEEDFVVILEPVDSFEVTLRLAVELDLELTD
jgi:hypothetical protein